jgi:hypothetical protein
MRHVLSLEQWTVLSRAIHGAHLRNVFVVINYRCFENDESFQQLLEGCSGVYRLDVFLRELGEDNSQCTAVAGFLRDPANMARDIGMILSH